MHINVPSYENCRGLRAYFNDKLIRKSNPSAGGIFPATPDPPWPPGLPVRPKHILNYTCIYMRKHAYAETRTMSKST